MNKTKLFLASTAAGAMALGTIAVSDSADAADKEKCYGVVKAGKNDCGNATGTHSCAGHATTDADGSEWVFVPKGLCERLAGGSTEPKS